jgi:hypothetical protein
VAPRRHCCADLVWGVLGLEWRSSQQRRRRRRRRLGDEL